MDKMRFESLDMTAVNTVINYIQFYNNRRIHGSLYDYAPFEFRKLLDTAGQINPFIVKA